MPRVVLVSQNGGSDSILGDLIKSEKSRTQDVLIVSQADISEPVTLIARMCLGIKPNLLNCQIAVSKAEGLKCERCWKYDTEVGAAIQIIRPSVPVALQF